MGHIWRRAMAGLAELDLREAEVELNPGKHAETFSTSVPVR